MLRIREGEAIRIVDRVTTPSDTKSGLYYGYYRNLSGTVFKIYGQGESAQAAIDVDTESLPEDVARRHHEVRDQMRANLSGEAKRQSGPGMEQEFRLRYVVLVALADLVRDRAARRAAS